MGAIIDFFVTLFVENADNIIENKKISKWIRYPIVILLILTWLILVCGTIILGIALIVLKQNLIAAMISILIGISFLIATIYKYRKNK